MLGWDVYHSPYEMLTDLCVIFLGLGKLYLNGKEQLTSQGETILGYISLAELANAYEIMNSLMNVGPSTCKENLTTRPLQYVNHYIAHRQQMWRENQANVQRLQEQCQRNAKVLAKVENLYNKILADHAWINTHLESIKVVAADGQLLVGLSNSIFLGHYEQIISSNKHKLGQFETSLSLLQPVSNTWEEALRELKVHLKVSQHLPTDSAWQDNLEKQISDQNDLICSVFDELRKHQKVLSKYIPTKVRLTELFRGHG